MHEEAVPEAVLVGAALHQLLDLPVQGLDRHMAVGADLPLAGEGVLQRDAVRWVSSLFVYSVYKLLIVVYLGRALVNREGDGRCVTPLEFV